MPAVSAKQKKFMDAAAHNPSFAKKAGVPADVAQEYSAASKGQKFGTGTRPDKQEINKPKTNHGDMALFKKGGIMKASAKKLFGGKESFKEELNEAKAIKSGKISPMEYAKGEESEKKMKKGGCTSKPVKMAKGGSVRGDGCAQRGKTKGRMI